MVRAAAKCDREYTSQTPQTFEPAFGVKSESRVWKCARFPHSLFGICTGFPHAAQNPCGLGWTHDRTSSVLFMGQKKKKKEKRKKACVFKRAFCPSKDALRDAHTSVALALLWGHSLLCSQGTRCGRITPAHHACASRLRAAPQRHSSYYYSTRSVERSGLTGASGNPGTADVL